MTLPAALALPLLVSRVLTDHPHHPATPDDLAFVTPFLYRRLDLHFRILLHQFTL
jgi:hypothetical protein